MMLLEVLRALTQDIYDKLGSGFDEVVYQKAFEVGLRMRRVPYESQRVVPVYYEGFYIGEGKPDLIVGEIPERVVIELKAVESVGYKERAQIENYLRVLDIAVGLLINFPQPTKSKAARDDVEFIEVTNDSIQKSVVGREEQAIGLRS
jgi:GxxExxY protein